MNTTDFAVVIRERIDLNIIRLADMCIFFPVYCLLAGFEYTLNRYIKYLYVSNN